MEEVLRIGSGYIALRVEAAAALVIAYGAIEALIGFAPVLVGKGLIGRTRNLRVQFGVWLLLGLEFELAADIVRTAITPSWTEIGQLASIAVIRTVLNYFLESDIENLCKRNKAQGSKTRPRGGTENVG
jgi:uncharacterized membrane protein